jgi:hypothetical protein
VLGFPLDKFAVIAPGADTLPVAASINPAVRAPVPFYVLIAMLAGIPRAIGEPVPCHATPPFAAATAARAARRVVKMPMQSPSSQAVNLPVKYPVDSSKSRRMPVKKYCA